MKIPREITAQTPIAFFCAEYAIEDALQLYAGGLGVLAGDYVLQAGAAGLPLVSIGLWYPGGPYSEARKSDVNTTEALRASGFSLLSDAPGGTRIIEIDIEDVIISAQVWAKSYGSATLYLLDIHHAPNTSEYRTLATHLYDADPQAKMFQELVLGIGGVKLLRALAIHPAVYHLNEGHTSFVALALAAEYLHDHPEEQGISKALKAVSERIVATKHTILPGAGIYFNKEAFRRRIEHYFIRHGINLDEFFAWGIDTDPDSFSATRFLLRVARASNAVSHSHAYFEKQRHPHSPLVPVTNGVYLPRWQSPLWSAQGAEVLSDAELWSVRTELRGKMVAALTKQYQVDLDPHALTVVWARRFASYKRPEALFTDLTALGRIVSNAKRPVQVVVSGTGREAGREGERIMHAISEHVSDPRLLGKVVYLPGYSVPLAKLLVTGADVWLNTPERGKEACGTSGMKAGSNGCLQMSTSDGWIDEVDWKGVGWVLPEEGVAGTLYALLENEVSALFYDRSADGVPHAWVERVRATQALVGKRFTAERMLAEYLEKMY